VFGPGVRVEVTGNSMLPRGVWDPTATLALVRIGDIP